MEILEYNKQYIDDIKELLYELQEYIVKLDKYNIQIITDKYKDQYFDNMIEEVNSKQGKIYIALENNKVLGFITGILDKRDKEDELTSKDIIKGRIVELCVTNKERSSGVGTLLINEMESYFKNKDVQYIYIDVFGYNEIATNFYYKQGYELRNIEVIKKTKED